MKMLMTQLIALLCAFGRTARQVTAVRSEATLKMPWTMQEMPSAARWMMSETQQKMQERQSLTQ
nr:hypothetical protein [uncultured Agathobaculum sp.]